jgi:hypothetical protein
MPSKFRIPSVPEYENGCLIPADTFESGAGATGSDPPVGIQDAPVAVYQVEIVIHLAAKKTPGNRMPGVPS